MISPISSGHCGQAVRFRRRSWIARGIVFAAVLAALTRTSADFMPRVMISHYEYAVASWAAAAVLWAVWHRRRFFKKDDDPPPAAGSSS